MRILHSDPIVFLHNRFETCTIGNTRVAFDMKSATDRALMNRFHERRMNGREIRVFTGENECFCETCGMPVSYVRFEICLDEWGNLRNGRKKIVYPHCVLCGAATQYAKR